MTARTPIERGAEALIAKSLADDNAMAALTDENVSGDDWDAAYEESLSTSYVIGGVVERIEGPPDVVARAVFESIDREGLIDVLVMSPLSDFVGTDMRPIERTADAIRDWLLSEGGA